MIGAPDDRGSVTAEFAVVVPAVVLLVALTAGSLAVVGRQIRLEHAVAQAARLAARGDAERAGRIVADIAGGQVVGVGPDGDLVCVAATASPGLVLPLPDLSARSCALDGGR